MNDLTKNILLWGVIVLVMFVVFSRYMPPAAQPEPVPYSQVLDDLSNNRLQSVTLQGNEIIGIRKDKSQFTAYNPETEYTALIGSLNKAGVLIRG